MMPQVRAALEVLLTREEMESALNQLLDIRDHGPKDRLLGVCSNVWGGPVVRLARYWPKFSGRMTYPVPHPSLSPDVAFMGLQDIWGIRAELDESNPDDRYRLNRWELLDWLIDNLQEYLGEPYDRP